MTDSSSSDVLWDHVKVKVQSQDSPVATHQFSFNQLEDSQGKSCLNRLQDVILSSAFVGTTGGLDLRLSLSYLDPEGDLVPLTTQEEWEEAIQYSHHLQDTCSTGTRSKALLVLAQVLAPAKESRVASPSSTISRNGSYSPGTCSRPNTVSGNMSKLEERLARMEDMLSAVALAVQPSSTTSEVSRATSPTASIDSISMAPPDIHRQGLETPSLRNSKDYTNLAKASQVRLTSRLNTVKQLNNLPSALSPVRPTSKEQPTTANDHNFLSKEYLEEFLDRIARERQEEMQQLMEDWSSELEKLSQVQEKAHISIQQALDLQQGTLENALKEHKTEVTKIVDERLAKMEQHNLVANAIESVSLNDSIENVTTELTTSIQKQLEQWQQTLEKLQSSHQQSNDATAIKDLQTNLQLQSPHLTSTSYDGVAKDEIQAFTRMISNRLDDLQQHVDTIIQDRVDHLAQQIQSQSLRQIAHQQPRNQSATDLVVSNLSGGVIAATNQALKDVVDARLAGFQHGMDTTLEQSTQSVASKAEVSSSKTNDSNQAMTKLTKQFEMAQDAIELNQKQYASALRQTMIRLHEETCNRVTTSVASALKNGDTGWESAKKVILSSHEYLRQNQQENLEEQKKYLVECIELSQRSILNKLTRMDINHVRAEERMAVSVEQIQAQATAAILDRVDQAMTRRQRWTPSGDFNEEKKTQVNDDLTKLTSTALTTRSFLSPVDGDGGELEKMYVSDGMEDLVFSAMEKLEEAMVANCEHIQAQATAAILDKIGSSQNAVEEKIDHCCGVLLHNATDNHSTLEREIESCHATVLDTLDSNQISLAAKLSASHSILELLQDRSERQQQSTQQEHIITKNLENQISIPTANECDMDGSRHGELRRRHDLDGSRNSSYGRRRSDLDDSKTSLHSVKEHSTRRQSPEPRPQANKLTVQRFLDIDDRSHQLEHVYKCIKSSRPSSGEAKGFSFALDETQ